MDGVEIGSGIETLQRTCKKEGEVVEDGMGKLVRGGALVLRDLELRSGVGLGGSIIIIDRNVNRIDEVTNRKG